MSDSDSASAFPLIALRVLALLSAFSAALLLWGWRGWLLLELGDTAQLTTAMWCGALAALWLGFASGGLLLGRLQLPAARVWLVGQLLLGGYGLLSRRIVFEATAEHISMGEGGPDFVIAAVWSAIVLLLPGLCFGLGVAALLRLARGAKTAKGPAHAGAVVLGELGLGAGGALLLFGTALLPVMGLQNTVTLGAILAFVVAGGLAVPVLSELLAGKASAAPKARGRAREVPAAEPQGGPESWPRWRSFAAGLALALGAIASLRHAVLLLGDGAPVPPLLLGLWLFCGGLGATLLGGWRRRRDDLPDKAGTALFAATGLSLLLPVLAGGLLVELAVNGAGPSEGGPGALVQQALLLLLIAGPGAFFGAGLLPCIAELDAQETSDGPAESPTRPWRHLVGGLFVGLLYGGRFLVPDAGYQTAFIAGAGVCVFAMLLHTGAKMTSRLAIAATGAAVVAIAAFAAAPAPEQLDLAPAGRGALAGLEAPGARARFLAQSGQRLVASERGDGSWLSIRAGREGRELRVDGRPVAATGARRGADLLAATLGWAYQPQAKIAAVVGAGGEVVADQLLLDPTLKRVELCSFQEYGGSRVPRLDARLTERLRAAFKGKRLRSRPREPRAWLEGQKRRFDLILSREQRLWTRSAQRHTTVEFYQLVRDRLRKGGVFGQLIDLRGLPVWTLRAVLRSMAGVFPQLALWLADDQSLIVFGADRPLYARPERARARLFASAQQRKASFDLYGVRDYGELAALRVMDREAVVAWLDRPPEARTLTDDLPLLSTAAWLHRGHAASDLAFRHIWDARRWAPSIARMRFVARHLPEQFPQQLEIGAAAGLGFESMAALRAELALGRGDLAAAADAGEMGWRGSRDSTWIEGMLAAQRGDKERALELLLPIAEVHRPLRSLSALAELSLAAGDGAEALKRIEAFLRQWRQRPRHEELALYDRTLGRLPATVSAGAKLSRALEMLDEEGKRRPDDWRITVHRAALLGSAKRCEDALKALDALEAQLNLLDAEAIGVRVRCLGELGRRDEAEALASQWRTIAPAPEGS